MKYTILETSSVDDTLVTRVLFDLDGVMQECSIHHFQPQTADEVHAAIANRAHSEKRKLDRSSDCETIQPQLQIGVEVEIAA